MRLLELFNSQYQVLAEGLLADGPIQAAKHFRDRVVQRQLDPEYVRDFIIRTITKHKQEIEDIPPGTGFILKDKNGLGVPVTKVDTPTGPVYRITTAHPKLSPRISQSIFYDFKESAELDKPTPTVGSIAEKNGCSLMAVELQLKKGVKYEKEHTNQYRVAREIALDHLGEDLYYYDKLDKIEGK